MGADEAHIFTSDDIYDASDKSYPEVLQHFTGLPTLSFGFPGATSDEISSMYTGLASKQSSLIARPFNSEAEPDSIAHEGDVLIVEMGSNGGWEDYDELIAQYWEMIEYGGCTDYLVLGDTDDPGTSYSDQNQWQLPYGAGTQETLWEQALHEAFGDHFVNLRVYLVEHGLEVTGLEATHEDTENAQTGCISEQLRADHTHLNSYGYYAQARAVYEQGVLLGYWS